MIQGDLRVENIDDAVRQQILGPLLSPSTVRPQRALLALQDTNGRDRILKSI